MATELSYLGPKPRVTLAGSSGGLVVVSLSQLDGPLNISGGSDSDCGRHAIAPGAPIARPYAKSGGWSNSDPNKAFYEAFFADPALRLPRGTWRVVASADFYVDECGGDLPFHELDATFDLVVE